ncbi:L-glutamate gamma-semialdehyde dehydrogenase [Limisalsivibrio acetivorans]|uniref:L-glutamate gamma-semialdehyde dehydrogenase n=1 Tax=Limisalsivibrio acetivorans TaxID=1304888 RepID=UPI0003B3B78D|nr:L-glutamate gamma-semialdehyde dehydrogenase [Limisalsivibrio acetivorans]
MNNSQFKVPFPTNEPVKEYRDGSPEKAELKAAFNELKDNYTEIPLIIGGKEIKTGNTVEITAPFDHSIKLGKYHLAGEEEVKLAIEESMKAREAWGKMPWYDRAAIFLKVAELLSTKYRAQINAATMLSIGKTAHQAEIDSACELIDFLRFNVFYMQQIYGEQPLHNSKGVWNSTQYRPLEGFILAVTPFNFTAIAGNLPTSPAMMGNVSLWKPSSDACYVPYLLMKIFKEAGLPDGVINLIPCRSSSLSGIAFSHKDFGGIHFTGGTSTFKNIWETIGKNIWNYRSYPRIVGETGGKDFIFAHKSADIQELVTASVRGAFEYQGQKCSAASRAYVPNSMKEEYLKRMKDMIATIKIGTPYDFRNFMTACVSKKAYQEITEYIDFAKDASDADVVIGGTYDDSKGWYIDPTVIVTDNLEFKTFKEEIFGPVLTVTFYDDEKYEEYLKLCNSGNEYALTGAIFAREREAVNTAIELLEDSAGNFYINDKPTGAVVGQQPFGGGRGSGTNDKAGSYLNLIRWVNTRTVKETFVPPVAYEYPFMEAE